MAYYSAYLYARYNVVDNELRIFADGLISYYEA